MLRQFSPLTLIALLAVVSLLAMSTVLTIVGNVETDSLIKQIDVVAETTMEDGSILVVNKVSYGTSHQLDVLVPRSSIDPFESPFRRQTPDTHTSENSVVIWMTRQDAKSGRYLHFDWWSHSTIADKSGYEHRDDDARRFVYSGRGSSSGGGNRPFSEDDSRHISDPSRILLVCSEFPVFRSDGPAVLKIYGVEGNELASVEIPNPVPQPTTEWTPEELPITRQNGDLELTLNHFNTKRDIRQRHTNNGRIDEPNVTFDRGKNQHWSLTYAGQKTDEWSVTNFNLSDALGNQSRQWQIELSPHEPAWRIEATAYRKETASFNESEIIRFDPIELPREKQVLKPNLAVVSAAGDATVRLIAGGGKVSYRLTSATGGGGNGSTSGSHYSKLGLKAENGRQQRHYRYESRRESRGGQDVYNVECELPHVLVEFPTRTGETSLTLRAVDDQDRKVGVHQQSVHGQGTLLMLETHPGATSVRIEAIIQTPLKFEFFIKPPEPRPLPEQSQSK